MAIPRRDGLMSALSKSTDNQGSSGTEIGVNCATNCATQKKPGPDPLKTLGSGERRIGDSNP